MYCTLLFCCIVCQNEKVSTIEDVGAVLTSLCMSICCGMLYDLIAFVSRPLLVICTETFRCGRAVTERCTSA